MKRPPSERPGRSGEGVPNMIRVGEPYIPGKRHWPERADYNWSAGGHVLRLFVPHLNAVEIQAVRLGKVEIGMTDHLPVQYLIFRFFSAETGLHVMSFDCSFAANLVDPADRLTVPDFEEVNPTARAILMIVLVEARSGVVKVIRGVTYSPEFTRALHRRIAAQLAGPFDAHEHTRQVEEVAARCSTQRLWDLCSLRCVGGA